MSIDVETFIADDKTNPFIAEVAALRRPKLSPFKSRGDVAMTSKSLIFIHFSQAIKAKYTVFLC